MAEPNGKAIASTVMSVFRSQRQQAKGGKEKFGNWNGTLARKLLDPLAAVFLAGFKNAKGNKAQADKLVSVAKQRALLAAQLINDTTSEWLQDGRDIDVVFSAARAVAIGITEATNAWYTAAGLACASRGNKLKWVTDSDPCPQCKSLNGQVREFGKAFRSKNGTEVFNPGLHPHCHCRVIEVLGKRSLEKPKFAR